MGTEKYSHPNIDLTDSKNLHLLLAINPDGLRAYFYNKESGETTEYMHKSWHDNETNPLSQIEDAVYDCPDILNDFSTTVIIESDKLILAPLSQSDNEEDAEMLLNYVYNEENIDLFTETVGDKKIIYSTAKGLKSFLNRTFSTEDIHCHLSPIINFCRNTLTVGEQMFVNLRKNRLDIAAFRNGNLLTANTFDWKEISDAAYYILNAWSISDFNQQEARLNITGNKNLRDELTSILRKYINYVMLPSLPNEFNPDVTPLSIYLLINEQIRKQ